MAPRQKIGLALLALTTLFAPRQARAQDPQRLQGVEVKAKRVGPGPKLFGGVVRDTAGYPVEGAEIIVPELQRKMLSKGDGRFRFDSMPKGTYAIRARKFGYAPQVRTIEVDNMGAVMDFDLVPAPRGLPSVVVSAVRGGMSGTVADTAYDYIFGAHVRVLGKDMQAITDSTGSFYLPVPEGKYMVAVTKPGYEDKLLSVNIPADSGRRVSTFMMPATARDHRAAMNIPDLSQRQAFRSMQNSAFYTRADLEERRIEWVYEAMNLGGQNTYDRGCSVIVNGGPNTAVVSTMTVDEIESIEVFSGAREGRNPNPSRMVGVAKGGQPQRQFGRPSKAITQMDGLVPETNTESAT